MFSPQYDYQSTLGITSTDYQMADSLLSSHSLKQLGISLPLKQLRLNVGCLLMMWPLNPPGLRNSYYRQGSHRRKGDV